MSEDIDNNDGDQTGKRSTESVLAETNRKFEKMQSENQKLAQQIEALTNAITMQQQQQAGASRSKSAIVEDENLEDLAFKDPRAYAAKVTERATQQATRVVNEQLQTQQRSNQILGQLVSDYPELNDGNSELTTKAVAIYKQMSEVERSNPLAYKAAVRDAAADLGILPKSKRKVQGDEEFQFSASNPRGENASNPSKTRKNDELDGKTAAFAKLIGLDTSKKEVVERLKSRQQRKNWSKYE